MTAKDRTPGGTAHEKPVRTGQVPDQRDCDLAKLVARITPENCHDASDFGAAVGEELW